MITKYRVAIADADLIASTTLKEFLVSAGHDVIGCVSSVDEIARLSRESTPDLVIVDMALGQKDTACPLTTIMRAREVPILALADHLADGIIDAANAKLVFGFLLKPIREDELLAAILLAVNRFHEFLLLREEASNLRTALENRKIIERARGILMKKRAIDEESAFRHMQLLARNHRQKLVDVAKGILIAEEALKAS